jgi:hypothetical protein
MYKRTEGFLHSKCRISKKVILGRIFGVNIYHISNYVKITSDILNGAEYGYYNIEIIDVV